MATLRQHGLSFLILLSLFFAHAAHLVAAAHCDDHSGGTELTLEDVLEEYELADTYFTRGGVSAPLNRENLEETLATGDYYLDLHNGVARVRKFGLRGGLGFWGTAAAIYLVGSVVVGGIGALISCAGQKGGEPAPVSNPTGTSTTTPTPPRSSPIVNPYVPSRPRSTVNSYASAPFRARRAQVNPYAAHCSRPIVNTYVPARMTVSHTQSSRYTRPRPPVHRPRFVHHQTPPTAISTSSRSSRTSDVSSARRRLGGSSAGPSRGSSHRVVRVPSAPSSLSDFSTVLLRDAEEDSIEVPVQLVYNICDQLNAFCKISHRRADKVVRHIDAKINANFAAKVEEGGVLVVVANRKAELLVPQPAPGRPHRSIRYRLANADRMHTYRFTRLDMGKIFAAAKLSENSEHFEYARAIKTYIIGQTYLQLRDYQGGGESTDASQLSMASLALTVQSVSSAGGCIICCGRAADDGPICVNGHQSMCATCFAADDPHGTANLDKCPTCRDEWQSMG